MGGAMKTRRGGEKAAFAYISVQFPAGSVCTCTKGTRTLFAPGKSGYALFALPEGGEWVLRCEEGSGDDIWSDSAAVNILRPGQTETVPLQYDRLMIFNGGNGGDNTAVTGGWECVGERFSLNVREDRIVFKSGKGSVRALTVTVNPV